MLKEIKILKTLFNLFQKVFKIYLFIYLFIYLKNI